MSGLSVQRTGAASAMGPRARAAAPQRASVQRAQAPGRCPVKPQSFFGASPDSGGSVPAGSDGALSADAKVWIQEALAGHSKELKDLVNKKAEVQSKKFEDLSEKLADLMNEKAEVQSKKFEDLSKELKDIANNKAEVQSKKIEEFMEYLNEKAELADWQRKLDIRERKLDIQELQVMIDLRGTIFFVALLLSGFLPRS